MRVSNKRINHARMVKEKGDSYIKEMRRCVIMEELSWYGVHMSPQNVLDRKTLQDMYRLVVDRVCGKYEGRIFD